MGMPSEGASSQSAVGSVLSGNVGPIVGGLIGYAQSRQEFKDQKELMDKSYQQSVNLWNLQNEYMSPKAQMQRFAEAGLNPDLIYGKLGDTSGTMPSVSTPQAPHLAANTAQGALAASQIKLQDSMAAKNQSETKSTDAQTEFYLQTFDTRVNQLTSQLNLTGFQAEWVKTMSDYQKQSFAMLNAKTTYWEHAAHNMEYEALITEKDYEKYDVRFDHLMSEVKSRIRLNNSTAQSIERKTRFLIETWESQKQRIVLENANIRSKSALNYAMSDLYKTEKKYLEEKTLYLPFEMIDELVKGGAVFEHNDDGSLTLDAEGHVTPKSWYSWTTVGFELAGNVMGLIGDVYGVITPYRLLKGGFSFNGIGKSAQGAAGAAAGAASSAPKQGFQASPKKYPKEYIDLLNRYKSAPAGSKEKAKLYNQLMRFKLD